MGKGQRGEIVRLVQTLLQLGAVGGLTDGQLLGRFLDHDGDEAERAFGALVDRHGPMVLRVCRSILRDRHDAEDAFQATFLVLARRAESIRSRDSLASWLYGAAYRIASCARSAAARRRVHERRAAESVPEGHCDNTIDDSAAILVEELHRLPPRFHAPLVLCGLEGLTHDEAARRLGWPVGTVRSRLARGRERLRTRLALRGLASAALVLAATEAVPATLGAPTVRAAVRFAVGGAVPTAVVSKAVIDLTKGAQTAMIASRLKVVALVLVAAGVACAGAGPLARQEGRTRVKPESSATVEALERRVRDLERKLDALLEARPERAPDANAEAARKVRVRFESLVEKIDVKEGQQVKKGTPLVELFSTELVAAKNDLLTKSVQWDHDKRLLDAREKLHAENAISTQALVDSRNDEQKSRLDLTLARDQLAVFGLGPAAIDAVKDERGEQKAHFTLRSPVDGIVRSVEAQPQDLVDRRSVLMTISVKAP